MLRDRQIGCLGQELSSESLPSEKDVELVLSAGYQMFVPKPVSLAELTAAIARFAAIA